MSSCRLTCRLVAAHRDSRAWSLRAHLHPPSPRHLPSPSSQVFAAVTGYFALGEVLTLPQILGGSVTLSAVFLISGNRDKKQAPAKQE